MCAPANIATLDPQAERVASKAAHCRNSGKQTAGDSAPNELLKAGMMMAKLLESLFRAMFVRECVLVMFQGARMC